MSTTDALPAQTRRTMRAIAADRLREREAFCTARGWAVSLYDRVLVRQPERPLPFRGRLVRVRVVGTSAPVVVRLGTSDFAPSTIFLRQDYARVIARLVPPVRTIVDLGANIGLSVRLWQDAFAGARIVAVEPDAGNMDICRDNVALGGGTGVVLVEAAVAGSARLVALDRSRGEWAFRMCELADGGGSPRWTRGPSPTS